MCDTSYFPNLEVRSKPRRFWWATHITIDCPNKARRLIPNMKNSKFLIFYKKLRRIDQKKRLILKS